MGYMLPETVIAIRAIHSSLDEFTLLEIPGSPAFYKVRAFAERDLSKVRAKQGIFGSDWKFEMVYLHIQHFRDLPVVKMWKAMGFTDRNCCSIKCGYLVDGHASDCITILHSCESGFKERLAAVLAEEEKQRRSRFPFNIKLASDEVE